MLFWVIAAVMTAAATLALLGPVARARKSAPDAPEAHDVEVYRDQLSEIDRDLADGLVDSAQADVARTEISRRLLTAARKAEAAETGGPRKASPGLRRGVALAVAVFMPVAALSAYIGLGRPDLPQLPLSARISAEPEATDISMLVARAEEHLASNPDDGRGWDVLGPIYMRIGRFDDAANAFQKAISILGPSPARQASLGEALFSAAGGIVTEEASLAFQTARELDPTDPRPRFYLAIGLAQSGKTDEAKAALTSLLESAPPGAPWIPAVENQIAMLQADGQDDAPRNPTAADIAAAQNMSAEDRQAMIGSMIESLAAKLAENPNNIDGWLRLVRSYMVSGDREKAQEALDRAFAVFTPSGPENRALTALANDLGLIAAPTLGGVPMAPATGPQGTSAGKTTGTAKTPFILPGAAGGAAGAASQDAATAEAPRDPSEAEMAAAATMSPGDRMAMIRDMVASLDEKLTADPNNLDGWLRLIRSYAVLGDRAAADQALARASLTFPGDSDGGQALAGLAAELGLEPVVEGQ
ncbi:c-type cytochrome biogenesis protein CcmI [Hoeflea olei]|uniref:Uncharacterized protein n=1 Tax=Hoeflea olei TaxID=1480615 RepID=A0A1C1YQY1_9HYPH|nr:c-type cytochrome biogenesis protein CcmI [Hoeflea olei]OCW55780.1 hypothetical protein AWJ14_14960 [Hoeflea olei]